MIIVDTGPLVSIADADDVDHQRCVKWISTVQEPLIVPPPILAEVCYMISRENSKEACRTEAAFLQEIANSTRFEIECLKREDLRRMAELVEKYGDFPLGGADASVVAIAERLNASKIATLDHRHFRVVRPKNVSTFTLLP